MGGSIWVESKLGEGSTFYFTIQAAASPSQPHIYLSDGWPQIAGERLPIAEPLRILVAEDDSVNQKLALYMLQKMGYQPKVVNNGLEAIQALDQQSYDVLLLDVQMPEMDGLAVARHVSQNWPPDQRPYMIAVTANAMRGDRELCLAAGMNDYVSKPVDMEALARAISLRRALSDQAPLPPGGHTLPDRRATPAARAPIEPETLARLCEALGENGAQRVAALVVSYLDDTPTLLAAMYRALDEGDVVALGKATHKLKSSSAFLGATALAGLCDDLERHCQNGTIAGCNEQILQIVDEYAGVEAALEQQWQSGNRSAMRGG
jgi:CheY-like chemotaxis protein